MKSNVYKHPEDLSIRRKLNSASAQECNIIILKNVADGYVPTWKYVQDILWKVFKRQISEQQVDHDSIFVNNNIFVYAYF